MSKISITDFAACGVNLLYYINDAIPAGGVIHNLMRWHKNSIWKEHSYDLFAWIQKKPQNP
jgi:hypothetical protein